MEIKENFIITGYGRSGTKYITKILSKSQKWNVFHEPRANDDEKFKGQKQTNKIQTLFNNSIKYGEVNSYLRFHYKKLNVGKKGIIIRNPLDIYLSVCNRKSDNRHNWYLNDIYSAYSDFIMDYGMGDIFFLKFDDYVGNSIKMKELSLFLGIEDLNIDNIQTNKINTNKVIKYKRIGDLPKNSLKNIDKLDKLKDWYVKTKSYYIK